MRADRLISIVLLLQSQRRLTARQLAERLEVSERTILRDMDALSAAGIPVTAERGTGGGWALVDRYQTTLTGLKEAEVRALFLSQPARLLSDLHLDQASELAFIKLLATLPAGYRRDAEFFRQRILVDVTGWKRTEEAVPFLPVLQDAIWQECQVVVQYRREDAPPVERKVDPLGLVAKGSVWYLVAGVAGEIRTYRVSRIQDVQLSDSVCVRPENFDLAAYWQQSAVQFVANLPRYPVRVRVAPELLPRLGYALRFARVEHTEPPDADGWSEVAIRFEIEQDACECLLGLGTQVEILEPPELRDQVMARAEAVVEFYRAQREKAYKPV